MGLGGLPDQCSNEILASTRHPRFHGSALQLPGKPVQVPDPVLCIDQNTHLPAIEAEQKKNRGWDSAPNY